MSPVAIVAAVLKIAVVLLFLLSAAAVLTWLERRQASMIQDRIGPNRAVIYVPSVLLRLLFAGAGVALAAAVEALRYASRDVETIQPDIGFVCSEVGVLVGWVAVVVAIVRARVGLRALRAVFVVGLVFHAAFALARFAPLAGSAGATARNVLSYGSQWLPFVLVWVGFSAALGVPKGRVGVRLAGLLHPVADGTKMAFKEDFVPPKADLLLHSLGPLVALFPVLVMFAVIPFGDTVCVHPGGGEGLQGLLSTRLGSLVQAGVSPFVERFGTCAQSGIPLQIADLNVGLLFIFAIAGTGIIGVAIAGFASDNKFSLLGGLRATSQLLSYEVALGLSLVPLLMTYGALRLDEMVRWQAEHAWGIFVQPVAFVLFLAATIAEQKRTPFDAPEGESEVVAGYFVEYSGMKFGMFYLGEYMEVVVSSALLTTVFFGGYSLPFLHRDGLTIGFGDTVVLAAPMTHALVVALGVGAFFAKTLVVCWAQLFIRWTVPRFRYDQTMRLGWRVLLPFAIANILVTGVVLLAVDEGGPVLASALKVAGDVTQAGVAVGALAMFVVGGLALLKPAAHHPVAISSSAKYAAAHGGTKTSTMQA
jgi:NADH-quinone oxidoreductase subunit H